MAIEQFFARTAVLVAVFATTLGSPAEAKSPSLRRRRVPPAPASGAASTGKSLPADPNYMIGAQDVLDISVWKEDS